MWRFELNFRPTRKIYFTANYVQCEQWVVLHVFQDAQMTTMGTFHSKDILSKLAMSASAPSSFFSSSFLAILLLLSRQTVTPTASPTLKQHFKCQLMRRERINYHKKKACPNANSQAHKVPRDLGRRCLEIVEDEIFDQDVLESRGRWGEASHPPCPPPPTPPPKTTRPSPPSSMTSSPADCYVCMYA